MDLVRVEPEPAVTARRDVPQLVPNSACMRCDVCCRFPEADSFLRPYFTGDEVAQAVAAGVDPECFPDPGGSQITPVKNPAGEGYLCPAFDPAANHCRIYGARPFDCRLYPLALMWDAARRDVLLGWDSKCPFMVEAPPPAIARYAEEITALLATEPMLAALAAHPRLIGRFQDDVVVLHPLPMLTARLKKPAPSRSVDPRLSPLTLSDAARLTRALDQSGLVAPDALAAYAFPYHAMWTWLLPYWWLERDRTFYLFADSPDGLFMPIPPLGPHPLDRSVAQAFDLMEEWNGSSPVSRIENVMTRQKDVLAPAGFSCSRKDGDYLYHGPALAALAGDRYKSQRALCNRAERKQAIELAAYAKEDQAECLGLYDRWSRQKAAGCVEAVALLLLDDAQAAHRLVFAESEPLGLTGLVARVGGSIAAYTFGYWLTPRTYCVLLEVADRTIPGLAQYLFRAACRVAVEQGAEYINVMEDAGLPGLRAAKLAYHPAMMIDSWTLTRPA
jgi:Fe-S-cluster containining protein